MACLSQTPTTLDKYLGKTSVVALAQGIQRTRLRSCTLPCRFLKPPDVSCAEEPSQEDSNPIDFPCHTSFPFNPVQPKSLLRCRHRCLHKGRSISRVQYGARLVCIVFNGRLFSIIDYRSIVSMVAQDMPCMTSRTSLWFL